MTNQQRIAVCISGQIRSSAEKLKEIAEKAREVDADVFISVWKERGGKTIESGPKHISFVRLFGGKFANFFPRNWIMQFHTEFPNWRDFIPAKSQVTEAELLDIFPDAFVEIEADKPELDLENEKNSLRMLYKIHRCNLLKKKYEKDHGFEYDRVIRVRPDMLIDFKSLTEPELEDSELLIFLRRENSVHDKYWAGSSDTDNIMADMYEYSLDNRISTWAGIHNELTEYIALKDINVVKANSTLTDFTEFGGYSNSERKQITENFLEHLDNYDYLHENEDEIEFFELASKIVRAAAEGATADGHQSRTPIKLDFAIFEKLEARLETAHVLDRAWILLPITTYSLACNPDLPAHDRAILAFSAMMDDALAWKAWLGYRAHNTVELMPEKGTELVPLLAKTDTLLDLNPQSDIATRLMLLENRFRQKYTDSETLQAQQEISHRFLMNRDNRIAIFNYLRDNKKPDELLAFAEMLHKKYPEQNNVGVMLAQAKNAVAEMSVQA